MIWVVTILLIALCFMLVVCYACVSNSSRISRAEERMKLLEELESCDTCVHRTESWASEACDGCCQAHSNYERESNGGFKEWEKPPKVEPKEVITTCVSVPAAILEANEKEYDDE